MNRRNELAFAVMHVCFKFRRGTRRSMGPARAPNLTGTNIRACGHARMRASRDERDRLSP
jgi:hypothetical protein